MYFLKGVNCFMIVMPIIVIFFQENDLTITEIMILQAVYSLTIAMLEIPSGFLADSFGRRNSIFISTVFSFIGYIILSTYVGFNQYLIAEILLGIGASLISGADSALIYDTLLDLNDKNSYTKIEGKNYAIGNFSEAIAGLLGGYLAIASISLGLYLPMYIQTFVVMLSIPIAYSLVEPKRTFKIGKSLKSIIIIVQDTLITNKKLKWYIIYSSAIGLTTLSIAWFVQPFLSTIEMPLIYFGIIWAALNIIAGITSYYSYLINNRNLLIIISLSITISLICLGFNISLIGLIFISSIYLLRGIITPHMRNLININTTSERRATVMSLRSFMIRLSFSLTVSILGYITDIYSINYVFFSLAAITGITSLLAAYKLSYK
ncbi:MAG: MFS transporter [Flavobacteriales bacterium]|nr:MFS transporter [Flavobacteriales bacterium]